MTCQEFYSLDFAVYNVADLSRDVDYSLSHAPIIINDDEILIKCKPLVYIPELGTLYKERKKKKKW